MLSKDLISCLCGVRDWEGRGGSFGGLSQSNFCCRSCGRYAVFLCYAGSNLLWIVNEPGANLSDEAMNWVNGPLLATWRDNEQQFKQEVERLESQLTATTPPDERNVAALKLADCKAGGPLAERVFRLLADPSTENCRGTLLYALLISVGSWDPEFKRRHYCDEKKTYVDDDDAPDRLAVLHDLADNGGFEVSAHARQILQRIELDKKRKLVFHELHGRPESPIPPQIPEEMAVWIYRGSRHGSSQWEKVDVSASRDLPIPKDPIRIRHDEYFNSAFAEVGLGDAPRREIQNKYYDDKFKNEPWYEFDLGRFTLTVGPRKRVVSVSLRSDTAFPVRILSDIADRDNTTYTADDGWKSKQEDANSVEIHAWGKEKLVEYLKLILDQIVGAPA